MTEQVGEVYVVVGADTTRLQQDMAKGVQTATAKSMASTQALGKQMTRVGQTMTRSVTLPVVGLGYAIFKTAGDFQASMNKVGAITGATGTQFDALRKQAVQLGDTTKFTASEAGDAMTYLGMAGFKTNQILSAMPGTLSLAAATGMDLATTADVMSNVLTGFNLQASESSRVSDVMAKTVSSANTNMMQLGDAMKYIAPLASTAGWTIEQTAAAVGLLGNAGIQGSMAGTTLRGMMSHLLNPTKQATKAMQQLGLATADGSNALLDASGKLLSPTAVIEKLGKAGLTSGDYMKIFGLRAGPGMAALVQQGSKALGTLNDQLDNAGGTAKTMADRQLQGLNGEMLKLKSASQGLAIAIGDSGLLGDLTSLTKSVTGLVSHLTSTNPVMLKLAVEIGGVLAVAGPLLIIGGRLIRAFGATQTSAVQAAAGLREYTTASVQLAEGQSGLIGKLQASQMAFRTMSEQGQAARASMMKMRGGAAGIGAAIGGLSMLADTGTGTGKVLSTLGQTASGALMGFAVGGPIGAAIGGGVGLLTGLVGALHATSKATKDEQSAAKDYAATLDTQTHAITENTRSLVAQKLQQNGVLDQLNKLGVSSKTYVSAILGDKAAAAAVTGQLNALQVQTEGNIAATQQHGRSLSTTVSAQQTAQHAAMDQAAAIKSVSDQLGIQTGAVQDAISSQDQIKQAVDGTSLATQQDTRAVQANTTATDANTRSQKKSHDQRVKNLGGEVAWRRQMIDTTEALKQNGKTLSLHTKAGLANRQALLDLADSWNSLTDKQKENTGNQKQVYKELWTTAQQMGMNKKAAQDYAHSLLDMPTQITTHVQLDTTKAHRSAKNYAGALAKIVTTSGGRQQGKALMGYSGGGRVEVPGYASAGYVSGRGSGTSDSILARLSNGEYVNKAAAVNFYGVPFFDALNRMRPLPPVPVPRRAQAPVPAVKGGDTYHVQVTTTAPTTVEDATAALRDAQFLAGVS